MLGEEQYCVVVGCLIHVFNEILIARVAAFSTHTTTGLSAVFAQRSAFDVAEMRDGDNHWVIGVEVFCIHLCARIHNLRTSFITVFVSHFYEFVFHHLAAHSRVVENLLQEIDCFLNLCQLTVQVVLLKISQLAQAHLYNGAGLHIIEAEAVAQTLTGHVGGLAALDDLYHLVNIVGGNNQTLKDVGALSCFFKLKLRAANHHFMTMVDKALQNFFQINRLRTSIHEAHIVDAE